MGWLNHQSACCPRFVSWRGISSWSIWTTPGFQVAKFKLQIEIPTVTSSNARLFFFLNQCLVAYVDLCWSFYSKTHGFSHEHQQPSARFTTEEGWQFYPTRCATWLHSALWVGSLKYPVTWFGFSCAQPLLRGFWFGVYFYFKFIPESILYPSFIHPLSILYPSFIHPFIRPSPPTSDRLCGSLFAVRCIPGPQFQPWNRFWVSLQTQTRDDPHLNETLPKLWGVHSFPVKMIFNAHSWWISQPNGEASTRWSAAW